MNNFEKIKQMTIEEMAKLFFDIAFNDYLCNNYCTSPENCAGTTNECTLGIKQWLESESEE